MDELIATFWGNLPMDAWPASGSGEGEPWATFVAARDAWHAGDRDVAVAAWRRIASDDTLESRHNLQAWHFLRLAHEPVPEAVATEALGVIAQVSVGEGHDTLAAYRDGSVRLVGVTGRASIVDTPPEPLPGLVRAWLATGADLAHLAGPAGEGEIPALAFELTRLAVLTPGGIRYGEGPREALVAEPEAAAYFAAATAVFAAVVDLG